MNRRQKIIVSVTGIFLVLLILVGLTYAYFLTQIQGNEEEKSISVTTANLVLRYEDGNGILTPAEKITPDSDVKFLDADGNVVESKTFNVINDGNQVVEDYAVTLENVKITYASDSVLPDGTVVKAGDVTKFVYPEDFEITVTCTSSKGKRCNGRTMSFPETNDIILVNTIEIGETHSYTLKMKYKESGIDQSADMNKSLTAKINIMDTISTIDLTGTVAYEPGDYVEVNSTKPIRSEITSDGKYKILGVEPDNHTINVKYKDNEGNVQTRYSYPFSVVKGNDIGVVGNVITINEDARTLVRADITSEKFIMLNLGIKPYNPYNEGTLAYEILNRSNKTFTELEKKLADVNQDGEITADDSNCIMKYTVNRPESAGITGREINIDGNIYIYGDVDLNGIVDTEDSLRISRILEDTSYKSNLNIKTDIKSASNDIYLSKAYDNYGTSYFYRGNVTTNYVIFNNLCWRIVRIEGDGSVKLILAGTPKDNMCDNLTTTSGLIQENGEISQIVYGYNLNENEQLVLDYENNSFGKSEGDLGLYEALTNWYNTNFDTEEKQKNVKQDTLWCFGGNANIGYNKTNGNQIDNILTPDYYYEAGKRFDITKKPNLICSNNEDKMNLPIGTLTMDEVVLAGSRSGSAGTGNKNYYLYEQGQKSWMTLSRYDFINDSNSDMINDRTLAVYGPGYIQYASYFNAGIGARPVISLVPGVSFVEGDGYPDYPYIIE